MSKNITTQTQPIADRITSVRGLQVILDSDIAAFYQYDVKVLNQAVSRNKERLPESFCFRLTKSEYDELLRSQFVTLKTGGRGQHRKYLPYVFTEQGVAMLAGILKSKVAISVSVQIIDAFVQMRRLITSSTVLPTEKIEFLESKIIEHDDKINQVFDYIERSEALTVSASMMDANIASVAIRPEIYSHIKKYLQSKDYFHAIEESYKIVRSKLVEITGQEKASDAIRESNYERLFGHQPVNSIEKDFFDGIKYLHMAVQYFRNEKVHAPAVELDSNLAIHYIVMASLAYDLISRGKKK